MKGLMCLVCEEGAIPGMAMVGVERRAVASPGSLHLSTLMRLATEVGQRLAVCVKGSIVGSSYILPFIGKHDSC